MLTASVLRLIVVNSFNMVLLLRICDDNYNVFTLPNKARL